MIFLWAQVFYIIWAGWTKPHDDRWYNFLERLNEAGLSCIGYILFVQTAFMRDQVVKYHLAWGAIWICVVLYFFNFISMLFVFCRELRHAYRMYSVKRKFILQYSRKGMIEQNYFKSSKDTGLKSKLKGKAIYSKGSSKDSLSPKKERRRRRRHGEYNSKSSLVAKNDVDDVVDADADSLASSEQYDQGREFKQKLRDAETAHKLHQIAEQDGEESDDGFGPNVKPDDYQLVSNRSTHRGLPTGVGTGTNLAQDSRMPLENDDFFSPINEEPEDLLAVDSKSSSTTTKKKKKKKKKKAALLAAIGEDLLDSPVQS